jgi:GT2 family glycosyltransferase
MKLGVVVLNWNGKDVTPRCLDSISGSACPADQVVVVDNASSDGSAELVRSAYPHVAMIVNDSNLGFAEGSNVGIRFLLECGFDLILLLNNDAVLDPDCLCELKRAAQAHPAAAYGATIRELSAPESLWYAGGSIRALTLDASHGASTDDARGAPRSTDFITGCCLMFRADALRRIGLLDRDFFAYYEDVDWCLRAQAAGEKLLYVPAATLGHDVSHSFRRAGTEDAVAGPYAWAKSRPLVLYLAYRNRLLLARKHARGGLHLAFLALRRLARAALHAAMLLASGRGMQAQAVLDGTRDGLRRPMRPAQIDRYLSTRPSPAGPR